MKAQPWSELFSKVAEEKLIVCWKALISFHFLLSLKIKFLALTAQTKQTCWNIHESYRNPTSSCTTYQHPCSAENLPKSLGWESKAGPPVALGKSSADCVDLGMAEYNDNMTLPAEGKLLPCGSRYEVHPRSGLTLARCIPHPLMLLSMKTQPWIIIKTEIKQDLNFTFIWRI